MATNRTTAATNDGSSSFKPFLLGQTASFLAYTMLSVAVGWQIYDLTGSAMMLGFVGLAQFLPLVLLTLVVGQVADSFDRRVVVMTCQIVELALVILLAACSLTGFITPWLVLASASLLGAARAFEVPTMHALLPSLVSQADFPRCLALSASGRQTGFVLGPALAGFAYLAGPGAAYGCVAASFLLAATCFRAISPPQTAARREPATLSTVLGGITYIRTRPVILGAISLDLFSVLLGGATALMPIFARDILHTGPVGLGLLRTAPAVGALGMSAVLARHPLQHRVGRTMLVAVAGFGLATVAFGLSRSLVVSLASLVLLGACDMISVLVRSSLVQLETPDDMRGRVSAVNAVFIGTSNQLGEFESGLTAAWLGPVEATVLGGLCTLVVVAAWTRLFPELARRDRLTSAEAR